MAAMLMQQAAPTDRVGRYPKHSFQTQEIPFTLCPVMIAPVLPGETLKNLYFETRAVSDPVRNPRIGWKKEYYFFYVRITDLLVDAIRDMFVDPANTDLSATLGNGANDGTYYTAKGSINYMKRCTEKVMQWYFADEDQALTYSALTGHPYVQIRDTYWMDSLTDKDLMPQGPAINTATTAGDLDRLMDAFEQLRALGIANMSYEDFLRSYGIAIPSKDENKPELLARFSDFQYPSNTITPGSGATTSALSWVFKNGHKDPKFFKEPGFICGFSVTRPKVYFGGLVGNMAGFMSRAWDWMPGYLSAVPETSLKYFGGDTGPLGDRLTAPDAYWADMRDLLLYGDQFQNVYGFAANTNPSVDGYTHMLPLPDGATFNRKVPNDAMMQALFVTGATQYYVRQDGVCSLSIVGSQRDMTVGNLAPV